MNSAAPTFRVLSVDCFERPLQYRLPFRFGAATVTSGTQAFVRARIRLADGREAEGATAELMVPKWFDKDPARTNDENVDQLRASLRLAASAYVADRLARTAFGHFEAHLAQCREGGLRQGMPALAAGFGAAEVDRAVLDALCRALGRSVFDVVRSDAIGFEPATIAGDLAGFDARGFLAQLHRPSRIAVRHTVGIVDALRGAPNDVRDGLPESLEQAIARYGLTWFKLKLAGDPHADRERLCAIASVLDALASYGVTLDGNEQYADLDALNALIEIIGIEPRLARLADAIAFLEQPLPRHATFDPAVGALPSRFPLLIDEADATPDAFPRAIACGYRGVSSKSCKGIYKSLVNAARCAMRSRAAGATRCFVSAEDLTTPAGLAVQQDTALAALLGVGHVERNGHHYIDGFAGAPAAEQRAFLAAHPDFYAPSPGNVRLAIHQGSLDLRSLDAAGFASAVLPDFAALAPLANPRAAPLATA